MRGTTRILLGAGLLLSIGLGIHHLAKGLVRFPAALERSLSWGPLGYQRWLGELRDPVRYLSRVTPSDARIDLVTCRPTPLLRVGVPYTLYPRQVRLTDRLSSPAQRAPWQAQACDGSWPPFSPPRGPWSEWKGQVALPDLAAAPRPRFLLALLIPTQERHGPPPRVRIRLGEDGPVTVAPLVDGRALLHRPVRIPPSVRPQLTLEVGSEPISLRSRTDVPDARAVVLGRRPASHHRFLHRMVVLKRDSTPASESRPPDADHLHSGALSRAGLAFPLWIGLGLLIVRQIPVASNWPLRLGLAWGAGTAAFGCTEFVLSWIGAPAPIRMTLMGGGALALLIASPRWQTSPPTASSPPLPRSLVSGGLVAVSTVSLGAGLVVAALFPRDRWDSFAFWGIKSKAIFMDGRLTAEFLARSFPHQDYPVLGPTLEAFLYRLAGSVCDPAAALLGPVALIACCLTLAGALQGRLPQPWPLVVATALAVNPRVVHEALGTLMDIHVAAFALFGVVLLDRARDVTSGCLLAGVMLGAAGFVKNDGMPWAAVAGLLVLAGVRRRRRPTLALGAGLLASLGPWLLFRSVQHLRTDIVNAEMLDRLSPARMAGQLSDVVAGLVPYLTSFTGGSSGPGFDGLLLLGGAGLLVLLGYRRFGSAALLTAGVATVLFALYLSLPPRRLPDYLVTTGFRVPLQLVPSLLFLAGTAMSDETP